MPVRHVEQDVEKLETAPSAENVATKFVFIDPLKSNCIRTFVFRRSAEFLLSGQR